MTVTLNYVVLKMQYNALQKCYVYIRVACLPIIKKISNR